MNVLHLWAVGLGAAALALPIVVHWLTKPRPVTFPTSTLRFIQGALRERRARNRLRDFVILGLRTAAILLIAAAFARPFAGESDVASGEAASTRVVLVDASQSLAAAERGIQAFERARAVAAERLAYRPGLAANVILAAARAEPTFARPSTNFSALREELSRATVRSERLDVVAALAAAGGMFGEEPSGARELVIVSDFQRGSWSRADFSVIPKDVTITFESVAPATAPDNVAVIGATVRNRATHGRQARVEIEAANYGPLGRKIDVELRIGEVVQRLEGSCAPFARTILTADVSAGAGQAGAAHAEGAPAADADTTAGKAATADDGTGDWQWGTAKLVGVDDALAADDGLPVVGRFRAAPRTALITRQPAKLRPSSSYFLATALDPSQAEGAGSSSRLLRIDPAQKSAETAAGCDLVVLDRPGRLSDEWISFLVAAARRGRVLFYAAEEAVDATNLRRLAAAADRDWRFPVDFSPPAAGRRSDLFLTDVKFDRPPFSIFGEQATAAVAPLRFRAGLATTPRPEALADDLLAVYGDRTACLAVGALGAGRVAVLNADLEASLLPRTEAFVPLVGELVDRLLDQSGAVSVVECGTALAAYLPTDAGPAATLESVGPDGTAIGRLRDEQLGVFWDAAVVRTPGVYRVRREGATLFAAAAVVPSEESDLRTLPADVLTERLAGGRTTVYRGAATPREPGDRRWVWLLATCVGCMLAEIAALKWFRT